MGEESLKVAVSELRALEHKAYIQRLDAFLRQQQEWVLLCRQGLLTRGQHTNNCSEVSIRILKDVILSWTKAYNAVPLTEYIIREWEKYFRTRLQRHVYQREPLHRIQFGNLLAKSASDLTEADAIVQHGQDIYSVPSSSRSTMYEVNANVGMYSCRVGDQGCFCKHQAIVQKEFGGLFPNSPLLNPHDCRQLAELALGSRLLEEFFFPRATNQRKKNLLHAKMKQRQAPQQKCLNFNCKLNVFQSCIKNLAYTIWLLNNLFCLLMYARIKSMCVQSTFRVPWSCFIVTNTH